jgi:hypothetical protein
MVDIDVEDSITGTPLNITNDHTDQNGDYDIVLPTGTFHIEYNAPPGVKLVSEIRRYILVQDDLVIDVVFGDGFYLSGRVSNNLGAGINQVDIDVDDAVTGIRIITPRDNTDINGDYQVVVPAGLFDITSEPPPGVRLAAAIHRDVEISGDMVLNFTLEDGYFVSGWVVDEGGIGLLDVDLDADDLETGETVPTPRDNTDNTGHYSIVLPAGSFSITYDPLTRYDLAASRLDSVSITGDAVLDTIMLQEGILLSGIVTDWLGSPVGSADLDVVDPITSRKLPTPRDNSDSTGHYQVTVLSGVYDLRMNPPPGGLFIGEFFPSVSVLNDTTVNFILGDPTGIGGEDGGRVNPMPRSFTLSQNYPNPFNPHTSIRFSLVELNGDVKEMGILSKRARLDVFDMRGRRVRVLVDRELLPGTYSVSWDGKDSRGIPVSSGSYVYRLRYGPHNALRKMVLLK